MEGTAGPPEYECLRQKTFASIVATLGERAMARQRRAVLGEAVRAVARLPAWLRPVGRSLAGCVLFASRPSTAGQWRANAAPERTRDTLEHPAFAGARDAVVGSEGRRDAS